MIDTLICSGCKKRVRVDMAKIDSARCPSCKEEMRWGRSTTRLCRRCKAPLFVDEGPTCENCQMLRTERRYA